MSTRRSCSYIIRISGCTRDYLSFGMTSSLFARARVNPPGCAHTYRALLTDRLKPARTAAAWILRRTAVGK